MKFGVVIFPGSNCDEDMIYVLQDIMNKKVTRLWHKSTDLENVDEITHDYDKSIQIDDDNEVTNETDNDDIKESEDNNNQKKVFKDNDGCSCSVISGKIL